MGLRTGLAPCQGELRRTAQSANGLGHYAALFEVSEEEPGTEPSKPGGRTGWERQFSGAGHVVARSRMVVRRLVTSSGRGIGATFSDGGRC